jgi:hypothetical protein
MLMLHTQCQDDLKRNSTNYLGKLRSNFVGTEFRIYDNGCEPNPSLFSAAQFGRS